MRVPSNVGNGKALVTLSFPDWKDGNVTPVTFAVPIVQPEPKSGRENRKTQPASKGEQPAPKVGSSATLRHKTQPSSRHLVLQAPPPISVHSVAVSPDGSLIGTAAGGVRLYDARTGVLLRAIDGAGDRSVAFSPDGRTFAAAGAHLDEPFGSPSNLIGIYDVQTGKRVQRELDEGGHLVGTTNK